MLMAIIYSRDNVVDALHKSKGYFDIDHLVGGHKEHGEVGVDVSVTSKIVNYFYDFLSERYVRPEITEGQIILDSVKPYDNSRIIIRPADS